LILLYIQWNKQQVGSGTQPHTAHAHFNSAYQAQIFGKYLTAVQCPVTVGIFKDQYPVFSLSFRSRDRISVSFNNPQTSAMVNRKADRAHNIRLGSSERNFKSLWNSHGRSSLFARK